MAPPPLVVPGTRYLGPFNSLDAGKPTCHADQLAREHDHDYHHARSASDVRRADRRAIAGFTADLVVNPNPFALIGAAGIGAKYLVESVTGVVYPTGLNRFVGKRNKEPSAKQLREYHRGLDDAREALEDNLANGAGEEPVPSVQWATPSVATEVKKECRERDNNFTLQQRTAPRAAARDQFYYPYRESNSYKSRTVGEELVLPDDWSWFDRPEGREGTGKLAPKKWARPGLVPVEAVGAAMASGLTTAPRKGDCERRPGGWHQSDWDRPLTKRERDELMNTMLAGDDLGSQTPRSPTPSEGGSSMRDLVGYLTSPGRMGPRQQICMAFPLEVGEGENSEELEGAVGGTLANKGDESGSDQPPKDQRIGGNKRQRDTSEKDKVELKRQRSSLQKQAKLRRMELEAVSRKLLDVEKMEDVVEKWEADWNEWGSAKEHIGRGPMQQATSRVMNLKENVINPLLKAYKDLAEETRYLRGRASEFTRMTDSVESIERLIAEERNQRRTSESSAISDMGANDVVLMLVELRKSLIDTTTRMEEKITDIGRETQKVVGRIDRLEREGLKDLSNKVEVVKRRVGQQPENQPTAMSAKPKPVPQPRGRTVHQEYRPQDNRETESDLNPTTPANTEDEAVGWEVAERRRRRKTKLTRKARTERREGIMTKKVEIAIDRSKKKLNAPRRTIIVKKQRDAPSLESEVEAANSGGADGRPS
uniref:Phospholipase A2-like domain-containing protein n=1 Tax=Lygus hesperus TaxID=30085 RepID=A0A0K8T346_LYGHE